MYRFFITSLLMISLQAAPCPAAEPANDVRVMSFNIRYGTANDGQNHWERRKEFLVQAEIDRTSRDGRTPSDHFPVTAVLRAGPTRTSPGN